MRKISLNTLFFAAFYTLAAIVLSRCIMEPVSLTVFLQDEKVIGVIEKNIGRVKITEGSDSGLTAGSGSISGLKGDSYYIVEEWDENGNPISVQFVSKNGTRTSSLTGIGRVSDETITGLTNSYNYRVRSAKPLTGQITYYDISTPPPPPIGAGTNQAISGGKITLPSPNNSYYLGLPSQISTIADYEIAKVRISPAGSNQSVTPDSPGIIKLEGKGTETDYVFAEINQDGDIYPEKFFVLKVTIESSSEANVVVTFSVTDQGAGMTVSHNTISQTVFINSGLTLTLSGAPAGAGISWRYDNEVIGTTATCTVPFNESNSATYKYIIEGDHTISVEITTGGRTYSKAFTLAVTIP